MTTSTTYENMDFEEIEQIIKYFEKTAFSTSIETEVYELDNDCVPTEYDAYVTIKMDFGMFKLRMVYHKIIPDERLEDNDEIEFEVTSGDFINRNKFHIYPLYSRKEKDDDFDDVILEVWNKLDDKHNFDEMMKLKQAQLESGE